MLVTVFAAFLAIQSARAQQPSDTRTWYQAYADAQKDIQDRNWQKAIADLAVASQRGAPKPGRNVLFYGDVYRDYNPDYYLGLAYMNLQRFAEADAAFERVRQGQLIGPRDNLYAEFTRQAGSAKDILQKQAADVRQSNAPTAAAQNAAATPTPQTPTQTAAAVPNASAVAPAAVATQSSPPLTSGGAATGAAQLPARTAEAVKLAAAPPRPSSTITKTPTQARPTGAVRSPAPPAAVPLDERAGLVQFFSGDYEAAAASLAAVTDAPAASRRAYFYLACSRAALVLTGRAPRSGIDEARAQLALANDTGQYAADKRLISPRIRQELRMQP